ncbi:MAG TPA: DUF6065 family protein [Conexibacter sp.]|nr:DUF6065 family protein [Conexibacter sp.]
MGAPHEPAAGEPSPDEIVAYRLVPEPHLELAPASRARAWMSGSGRFARRCLPMVAASELGWVLLSRDHVRVSWNGGSSTSDLVVEHLDGPSEQPASSHFGVGVVTWEVPYLFRTPPGWNLLVRGPANAIKDGAVALEGLVETDWATARFSMSWRLTRRLHPVEFAIGEPIAALLPIPRGVSARFTPVLRDIAEDPELEEAHRDWAESRDAFLQESRVAGTPAHAKQWQRDYYRGLTSRGERAPEHERHVAPAPFTRVGDAAWPASSGASRGVSDGT